MVFKRYANPFSLFDELIENNQFDDFIVTLNDTYRQEIEYEVWLHKVFNKDFNEFQKENHISREAQDGYMTEDDVKTTVNRSKQILSDFKPQ